MGNRRSFTVGVLTCLTTALWAGEVEQAAKELAALAARAPGFRVIDVTQTDGQIKLQAKQSLTIADLRGVPLDDSPPQADRPAKPYDRRMTDRHPAGRAPYVAEGIQPFRFRWFTNEFSYGGWHNFALQDYASTHGFNVLYPYRRTPEDWTHAPAGTKWLRWGGFVNWTKWLKAHNIGDGRYDQLVGLDLVRVLTKEGIFKPNRQYDQLMIDMEHPRLSPEKLRQQPWYPEAAGQAARQAFEKRYYDGYASTYTAPVAAARSAGWRNISVYGWQPLGRRYWGIDKVRLDPATDWAWQSFGKRIYDAVDILNPSVYCFYWSPVNVAYTLANIDLNMVLVNSMPERKPVRPYYWTLLHGGGGGTRWWRGQPLPNEDVRAMTAFCFFTGCDGLVLWNWSGTGTHHVPTLKPGAFCCVGKAFGCENRAGAAGAFKRYDVLHVQSVTPTGMVQFQRVEKDNSRGSYGLTDDKPKYEMHRDSLLPLLRAQSEPVGAMVEGMALVKPFEYILRNGRVCIDVSAQEQFGRSLPIARRIALGPYHVVATYDPLCAHGGSPRTVEIKGLAGRQGLSVVLPADGQTRVFVLRVEPQG